MALAVVALGSARPGRDAVAAVVALALVWSTAPLLVALSARRQHDAVHTTAVASSGTATPVTTLVRPGDEPPEVLADTVAMALSVGPTLVVADRERELPTDLPTAAVVCTAKTVEQAIALAAARVDTPATLLVSGRAAPAPDACTRAAHLLGPDTGWVTGRVTPFNRDGFAADARDEVGAELRSRAAAQGLVLWEPDATLVRTELLREHPLRAGRPWGTWLRARRDEGWSGVVLSQTLAFRAAPADAAAFWPDTVARQGATAADLASAATSGPLRTRLLAAALLVRELYAVGLLGWLTVPVLLGASGEFPFDGSAPLALVAATALLVLRWAALRADLRTGWHPRRDIVSALHHLPGSLAAVRSGTTRRIRPLRPTMSNRPLVWGALVLALLAGTALVDRNPGAPVSRSSVGTALGALALLWVFTMRSLLQRTWIRSSARTPLSLEVRIGDATGRTLDASPRGLSVSGDIAPDVVRGVEVEITLELDDGELVLPATVASRRTRDGSTLLGLALDPTGTDGERWLAQVLAAAADPAAHTAATSGLDTGPPVAPDRRARLGRAVDRAAQLLVAGVSVVLVGALVMVLLGFRPLVVRSESMVPTLQVGDVVLAEQVRASELRPGDVVTQPERSGREAMTHRVRSVDRRDGLLEVTTRGDANATGETWPVHPDELVGRMSFSVPVVGVAATGVRTSTGQLLAGILCVGLVVIALVRPRPAEDAPGGGRPVAATG